MVLLIAIVALAGIAYSIGTRALEARDTLESSISLVSGVQESVLAGDVDTARSQAAELAGATARSRELTDDALWRSLEWVPVAGPNLEAVRTAAAVVDDLATDAVEPVSTISVQALKPRDGRIDPQGIIDIQDAISGAADSVVASEARLDELDSDALVDQVTSGVTRLESALSKAHDVLVPAQKAVAVLPPAIGAEGPRNYLMLFQNNAEARGTGGNPASILHINVTDGVIDITQQASSRDFANYRDEPIIEVNEETEALYGDKIASFIQDSTLTPDFPETAEIVRAFWAESFGTPVDGVLSFDPVALSYLLGATGPVTHETGDVLTAENAVPLLLNEAYLRYPGQDAQDAFFAAAAGSIFTALTSGNGDLDRTIDALARATDEGRLLYVPVTEAERELVEGTRILGTLPVDNTDQTVLGVYVNDVTGSKMDYYLDAGIRATADTCAAPVFTSSTTLTSTLDFGSARSLPRSITGPNYTPGDIGTDLVLYGPTGGTFRTVSIDGVEVPTRNMTVGTHLGRPAVKVYILNEPGSQHTIDAVFDGAPDQAYGELVVQHTPMVRPTPVELTPSGCSPEQ